MKSMLLLLLALPGASTAPGLLARGQVTFSPLTKAAYLMAHKGCVTTRPRVTFPLKKQGQRLVIPTAEGQQVFADIVVDEAFVAKGHSEAEGITYTYYGYLPALHHHLVQVSAYETEQWLVVSDAGRRLVLWGEPLFAPDGQHLIAACQGLEYSAAPSNGLQLLALQNGALHEVWRLEPKTWEPKNICWTSDSTLLLSRAMWTGKNPGTTYTYARLTLK